MSICRFHELSHSCASLLFSYRVSLKEIQEWLGHGNISTHMDFNKKISSADAIIGLLGKKRIHLSSQLKLWIPIHNNAGSRT